MNKPSTAIPQTIQFTNAGPVSISLGQTYTNALNPAPPGTGTIIYSSSNSSVGSITAQGVVTGLGIGTTTITATKLADDIYLSATNMYTLQVINTGSPPVVSIEQVDGFSVQLGDSVDLQGFAEDAEDGTLPTKNQSTGSAAGIPITTLKWESNIDGLLGYGDTLQINTMSAGEHTVSYSATDSDGNTSTAAIRVLVGNIAPLATASASSTFCSSPTNGADCYSPARVNDTSLSNILGGLDSWVNDDTSTPKLPHWVALSWLSVVEIHSVDVYTTTGFIIRDYDIEYFNGETWVVVASITDNTEVFRSHKIPTITTSELRILAKKGSLIQPQYARINEVVVFGSAPTFATSF